MNESQINEYQSAIAMECGKQVQDLMDLNLTEIVLGMDTRETDKAGVSIKLDLERGPNGFTVKSKLTYTTKVTDEAEGYVDRPDQVKIDFTKKREAK